MSLKRVVAIFHVLRLEAVEKALISHGVMGFTVQRVMGRGAYFDSYNRNPLTAHIRLESFTSGKHARAVAEVIMDAAHVDTDDEGLVSIEPIDDVYWIHTMQHCDDSEFDYHEVTNG